MRHRPLSHKTILPCLLAPVYPRAVCFFADTGMRAGEELDGRLAQADMRRC